MNYNPNKPHSDKSRWICLYPAYLDSKRSLRQGRVVPKELAVENPTFQEMSDVLTANGFRHGIENKLYCREPSKEMQHRGRVRVHLRNDDGSPCNATYPTRDSILSLLGEMIPKLKSRVGKQGTADSQHGGSSSSGQGKKGKGKGKR